MRWAIPLVFLVLGCGTENRDWQEAQATNTLGAFESFLEKHPDGEHAEESKAEVVRRREDQGFQRAQQVGTADAYRGFLEEHPEGTHASEARTLIEEFDWGRAREVGTAEAYRGFLEEHGEGPHASEAQTLMEEFDWKAAEAASTVAAFEEFAARHPSSTRLETAGERIGTLRAEEDWANADKADSADAYRRFAAAHPEHAQAGEAKLRADLAEAIAACQDVSKTHAEIIGFTGNDMLVFKTLSSMAGSDESGLRIAKGAVMLIGPLSKSVHDRSELKPGTKIVIYQGVERSTGDSRFIGVRPER